MGYNSAIPGEWREKHMNSQMIVVFLALGIALLMAIKPELFIINPDHRTPRFLHNIKYVGMSVSIVFLVWIAVTLLRR